MSTPSGDYSATKKGTNGKVDLKANGMTTEATEGPHKSSGTMPDASGKTVISRA